MTETQLNGKPGTPAALQLRPLIATLGEISNMPRELSRGEQNDLLTVT
jgi:hypothetical protein